MSNITSIANALDFIEGHLKEEITIADIADAVYYSLFHFCRMFNKITHHTPYDYLMQRRVSEAARELVETRKKIIEIAFDYQFNSPETFGRAFKRMFGMLPSQWRKQGTLPTRLMMPRLTRAHLEHLNSGDALKPVLETKDALHVAGLMTVVKDDESVIATLWEMLTQELDRLDLTQEAGKAYGLIWYPTEWETRGILYLAAREMPFPDDLPSALVKKTLPPATYARFLHNGPRGTRHLTLDYIYHTWLPKSGHRLTAPLELESPGDISLNDPNPAQWEIWLPVEARETTLLP